MLLGANHAGLFSEVAPNYAHL